jgi:hypothetical protein
MASKKLMAIDTSNQCDWQTVEVAALADACYTPKTFDSTTAQSIVSF